MDGSGEELFAFFFKRAIYFICVSVLTVCVYVRMCMCMCDAYRGEKKTFDPLELKLWMIVSSHVSAGN